MARDLFTRNKEPFSMSDEWFEVYLDRLYRGERKADILADHDSPFGVPSFPTLQKYKKGYSCVPDDISDAERQRISQERCEREADAMRIGDETLADTCFQLHLLAAAGSFHIRMAEILWVNKRRLKRRPLGSKHDLYDPPETEEWEFIEYAKGVDDSVRVARDKSVAAALLAYAAALNPAKYGTQRVKSENETKLDARFETLTDDQLKQRIVELEAQLNG